MYQYHKGTNGVKTSINQSNRETKDEFSWFYELQPAVYFAKGRSRKRKHGPGGGVETIRNFKLYNHSTVPTVQSLLTEKINPSIDKLVKIEENDTECHFPPYLHTVKKS